MSPRAGDWVRAVTDNRAATQVEGVLNLRYVPSSRHVLVEVIDHDGHGCYVDPASVVVLEPAVMAVEDLEAGDPLPVVEPEWRRIESIEEAARAGLLPTVIDRPGGTWEEMFDELDRCVAPLIEAGWEVVERTQDEEYDAGLGCQDIVACTLRRNRLVIEVDFHCTGGILGYQVEPDERDEDEELTPPRFDVDPDRDFCIAAYTEQGWLP